jgi:hypothetical protein
MRGFPNASLDPTTKAALEAAFDEAWLTLKALGDTSVTAAELAQAMMRLAERGERDPARLHDDALSDLVPAEPWLAAREDPI